MPGLHLEGPLVAWSDTALAARLGEGTDARKVMVFLGPDTADGPAPAEAERAHRWVERAGPGLLPLIDVVAHGSRLAWVHPRVDALGLVHLVDAADAQRPPLRVVAEIVAAVADALHAQGASAADHPGPSPEDVGLDGRGQVLLTGFGSPWPAAPIFRDPSGGSGAAALAWRVGVLLTMLLAGRVPAVTDRATHEAMIRRVLIRSMSRSGPTFSERYRDWLTALLAWEPDLRPSLSAVGPGLREVGRNLGGPDVAAWCAQEVPLRLARAQERGHGAPSSEIEGSFHPWTTGAEPSEDHTAISDLASHRTLPGLPLSALERDEPTAESTIRTTLAGSTAPMAEPGTMPVGVGPPVEALPRRPPTLPAGFLDGPSAPAPPPDRSTAVLAQLVLLSLLGGVISILSLLVLLVLILN